MTETKNNQLNQNGKLHHLLSIEGLNQTIISTILDKAKTYFIPETGLIQYSDTLKNKTLVNLFFEASTRTRSSFELAAKRLSATVLNFNLNTSALSKGENLGDTLKNLAAMQADVFVIRHSSNGAAQFAAELMSHKISVINAGDGTHEHPTQALLDIFTIQKHRGDLKNLSVAIIGDILHSRVARSQIHALNLFGTSEIRLIGPKSLLPAEQENWGPNLKIFHNLSQGLKGVDIIISLRLQRERMLEALIPSPEAYYREFGLSLEALGYAKPNALVLHPGPMNRGIEIQSEVADGPRSVILDQVTNGLAVRMAVLEMLANK